jgi:pimeloyl-ACP methyl ester carboxylesterase
VLLRKSTLFAAKALRYGMMKCVIFSLIGTLIRCSADTLLDDYFCQLYYPKDASAQGLPPCTDVRAAVVSNMSRTFPTLELGSPSKPAMFFVHGWPDSAAEFAAQFGAFCHGPGAKYRCVAITWQNFHPDMPDAPEADLVFTETIDKIAATIKECKLLDPTFIIHDWGSFIGYNLLNKYPDLMERTVSFDIGSGGHPNVTYQAVNAEAWETKNSALSESSANYWQAPCPQCAVWRTAWPYVYNLSMKGLTPMLPPGNKPLLFMWGNMTRGNPRGPDSKVSG